MDAAISFVTYSPWVGAAGFLFAVSTYFWILKQPAGNAKMTEISGSIEVGAMAFLKKEYSILIAFLAVVTILLGVKLGGNTAICYIIGALASMLCGFVGMKAATKANVRTAEAAASSGQAKALSVAFFGGSVMGMSVASIGLMGVALAYTFLTNSTAIEALNGFAMGASSIALFARVGGGIYTKAADVGADLVGKVEAGIPEDDPRNPATIADNVGDNVGDTAGMGADIFESYVGSIIGAMVLGATSVGLSSDASFNAVMLPLVIAAAGIVVSIIGTFFVSVKEGGNPQAALNKGTFGAAIVMLPVTYFVSS